MNAFDAFTFTTWQTVRRYVLGDHRLRNAWRHETSALLGELNRRNRSFGDPHFARSEAEEFCDTVLADRVREDKQELDEDVKKQLEDLGYRKETIE
jgi:hypothetical protein